VDKQKEFQQEARENSRKSTDKQVAE